MEILQFISDPNNDFLGQTIAYLELCVVAIIVAIVLGVGIGAAVSRSPILAFIAVNLSGLMRAIPAIAFLLAAVPFLGLGFVPAVTALIILGIPPILLNTYTGIRGIDPSIIDSGRGMGMTTRQIVRLIQAPIVLPIVAAGIRTAAVQIVATATLAGFIGAGGYGNYIVDGLNRFRTAEILAGAIPVTVLAMIVEVAMGQLQNALTSPGLKVQDLAESTKA